jgi:hypothetical protein
LKSVWRSVSRLDARQRYEQLLRALIRSDRLTEAEARLLPPQIGMRVFDDRIDRSQPLPALDISP